MSERAMTYVLVPGSFQGGWAWRPVAARLRANGHRAVTMTLPGLGDGDDPGGLRLQDAADHIVDVVNGLDDARVTVVGHSWSAFPIAGPHQDWLGGWTKSSTSTRTSPSATGRWWTTFRRTTPRWSVR